ncbi:MAG: DNA translocase FtsK 4TM domain-containing protein [Hyphomicrobium sp.]
MSLDTRGNDPQRLLPQSVEDRLLGWLGVMGGIALLVTIVACWVSLATWSIKDPSLTHATAVEPRNILGPLGAIVSDLLLQTFGLVSALALLPPMLWALELTRTHQLRYGRSKIGYYPIAVLALAGALASYPALPGWPLNHGLGGAIGDGLFSLAANLFKLINKDRADLAAALLLNLSAFALLSKSTGLDLEAFIKALISRRNELAHEQEDAARGVQVSWLRRFAPRRATMMTEFDAAAAQDSNGVPSALADEGSLSGYAPQSSWEREGSAVYAPVAHALDRLAAIAERQEALLASHASKPVFSPAGVTSGFPSSVPFHPAPPIAAHAARAAMPGPAGSISAGEFRGIGFDVSTDAASQAIAARFAPPSAAASAASGSETVAQGPGSAPPGATTGKMPLPALLARAAAERAKQWKRPSLNLLKRAPAAKPGPELSQTVMRGNARLLEDVLNDFGIKGEVKDIKPGPVVTLYEMEPARGTKSSRVIGLADDIARSMSVVSVRAAVVPGRNAIGIEMPNMRREPVLLREMLESEAYRASDAALPLTLGKSISGEPIVADLARMPHLLVAGTTGSGKSVGVNAFILSLLYRHSPNECRFLMIDPKMLELSVYNGIPHLLTPVVTDPHKAVHALNWAVGEMEERYKRMATLSVRNIDVFNNRVHNALKRGELLSRTVQTGFDKSGQAIFEKQKMNLEPMPRIVIVVDEFADLMVVAGKEVEGAVQRLAQMARAAGIHLIMATQRPSVDVITGTIKANFPTRISFKVTSKIDSRTILNEQGAEQLLGQGDMLYSSGAGQIVRVHGAFVADDEVEAIADALRQQGGPQYIEGLLDAPEASGPSGGDREVSDGDLYDRAVAIVLQDRRASTSYLQRRLSIGYNRAADLIERMEREGVVTPASPTGKRDVLAGPAGNIDAA